MKLSTMRATTPRETSPTLRTSPTTMWKSIVKKLLQGWGGVEAAVAVGALVAPNEVDVMCLSVTQLKEELRKRGRGTQGRKSNLQDCLKEGILLNVPVALGNEVCCQDCMVGLDVTAKWELLTWCDEPVPEPNNVDADLRPSIEMNAAMNPKYSFVKTLDRIPFTGTMEKILYCWPKG
jgi:hypothetical protein